MAAYQFGQSSGFVLRESDGVWIHPWPAGNADWAIYQAWLTAGNTPDSAPQLPPPPSTPAGYAAAMLGNGMPLTSTSNPSLNAGYPCSATSVTNEMGQLALIAAGVDTPNPGYAIVLDLDGYPHAFTVDEFKAYCAAKAAYMQTLNTIIGSNTGSLPTVPVTIP